LGKPHISQLVEARPAPGDHTEETALRGWGERIRTLERQFACSSVQIPERGLTTFRTRREVCRYFSKIAKTTSEGSNPLSPATESVSVGVEKAKPIVVTVLPAAVWSVATLRPHDSKPRLCGAARLKIRGDADFLWRRHVNTGKKDAVLYTVLCLA
jgi:hypothetical protein